MRNKITFAAIVAAAGLAVPAIAQDSVSNNPGTFVGDALVPWLSSSQCADFVVDLSPIQTSRGTTFGVAPLLKSSKVSADFFSSLVSAQSVSATELIVDEFARPGYNVWSFPGGGVNFEGQPVPNVMGDLIVPTAEGEIYQFSAGFSEFATTDAGGDYGGVIAGLVNYDKANPARLYVTRNVIATNRSAPTGANTTSFGFGTVDANGNVYFRADDFGTGGNAIAGNNIFRVSILGRDCDVVNQIVSAGAVDATASDWIVRNQSQVHSVPGNIPQDVAGRPVYVGYTFGTELARETSPLVVTRDGSHLGGLATDHRGNIGTYRADLLGNGGVATGGVLSKSNAGGGATDSISLYSMDASGNPVAGSPEIYTIPGSPITDPFDNFTINANGLYEHYRSQTAFRGGNAPVAIGTDAEGNTLFAGVTHITGGQQDPFNAMPVGRIDAAGNVEYSLGAWIDIDANGPLGVSGKPIYDATDNVIGQLRPHIELFPDRPGPSISAPAFDGAGNLWFVGVVALDDPDGGEPVLRTTLIRGIYQPEVDGGGFGYQLEKVLSFGDVVQSQNTGLDYFIGGFQIADADSVNSATLWSSNVKQSTWGGVDPADLDSTEDPRSTAGVVIAASITYDVDQNGEFSLEAPTADEAYNVLLYVSNIEKAGAPACPQDLDGSGVVDASDLAALISQWGQFGTSADFAGNGVGADDLAALVAAWGPCPQ